MTPLLTTEQRDLWRDLVSKAHHIVITAHRGPDGDAIGSTTALASWLRRHWDADVRIVVPNIFPDFLHWVPGAADIYVYDHHEAEVRPHIEAADLIIMCDHGELSRMAALGDVVRTHDAPRIIIDHHLNPEPGIAQLAISHPECSSCCEVLMRIMLEIDGVASPSDVHTVITPDEATSLYTGMMTDTGAFTYASNRPEVFELVAQLLRCGIDKDRIYRNVFFTYSAARMKFQGYMLYSKLNVWKKAHTAILTLTNAERHRFGILNGDTEGLVNMPLQIQGIKLSIFLREDTEQPCIRLSLRSVDDFPCNELAAEFFGGGGHKNAAGGEFWGTMADAVEHVKRAVQKYMPRLRD